MSFTVQIEDEHGRREGDPWVDLRDDALLGGEHPGTTCLRFLDPYGDTIFNQSQIPVLLVELRALALRQQDAGLREAAESLEAFVRRADEQIHLYVRFVGD